MAAFLCDVRFRPMTRTNSNFFDALCEACVAICCAKLLRICSRVKRMAMHAFFRFNFSRFRRLALRARPQSILVGHFETFSTNRGSECLVK